MLSTSLIGCRDSSGMRSIRGHVSYQGEAITNGSVTFFPVSGRPVSAGLHSSGEYTVELVPGDYRVVINIGAELPAGWKEGDPVPPPKIVLPAKYTTRVASSLTATVTEDQSDPIDFVLE